MQDEESLVRRAQHQDQEAFAQLYEAYFDKIYRYLVIRIGNKAEAEDMTQQVFLNALKSISSFKWKGVAFSAWLYRIAHNLAVDYLRKKSKQSSIPLDTPSVIPNTDEDPRTIAERKLDIEHLLAATKQLTAAQQEVISLRFTGGLPIAQVAKIMGKSQGAVKALQHSAVAALRKLVLVSET